MYSKFGQFIDGKWQQSKKKETYDVIEAFPKAGVVSPFPNPKLLRHNTANIIAATLFSNIFIKRTTFSVNHFV